MDYKNTLLAPEYDFLKTNKHLGDNIVLLTLGGSHAYGMNIASSDLDIRGIALNSKKEILLGQDFEQIVEKETDTTVYSIKKIFNLLAGSNPNTIEILGCKPEHYLYLSDVGKEILENKEIFLSQRAINAFKGYAFQQLSRLQAALARDKYAQEQKEEHILSSCFRAMMDFGNRYTAFDEGSLKLFIDKARSEDLTTEIYVDANLKNYPLRDFKNIMSDLNNIINDYSKLNKRNHKKDDNHLNKHAAHLVRLQLMAMDLLKNCEVCTFREKDHNLLMSIRMGEYQQSDGTFKDSFFKMVNTNNKILEELAKTTKLPEYPNMEAIEKLFYNINYSVVTK